MIDNNLAAPCGIYCGACRQYLVLKKNQLEQRGFKRGCEGCRIRNKNCVFIRKDCSALKKNQIEYCNECNNFPCQNLQKMDNLYQKRYAVNMIGNLKRIKDIGVEKWLQEQKVLYTCPECGGEICVHDAECYDCGYNYNPNK
jgi:predicted RNA-binding Zn-ribbon protein involved in translation (DUF1610 family)